MAAVRRWISAAAAAAGEEAVIIIVCHDRVRRLSVWSTRRRTDAATRQRGS